MPKAASVHGVRSDGSKAHLCIYSTSGNPAMLVSMLNIPASADALKTINQSTCEITAVVPIVAIAVGTSFQCAIKRSTRFIRTLFSFTINGL